MENKEFTFFGDKKIPFSLKTNMVDKLFSDVASKYDLMNDLMSAGIHRIWKNEFCLLLDNPSAKLLDVAGGTCDISRRFYEFSKMNSQTPDITVCDLNFEMLSKGIDKLTNLGILGVKFVNSSAENLPFQDNSFDYYTVAFGIRNFTDMEKALKEAKRVLKKGGKFLCLEFSKPQNKIISKAYKLYSNLFIPNLGALMGDRDSYKYLVETIERFPSQEKFAKMIAEAGFKNVSYRNLSDGIVAIHTGYK